ncbi:MAG: nuclear transport factor 2 family protein [candidate division WOR-3 bacterium]|nr:MAG: nuclear transport factor 2 family protein [candidate division WOR-3 bacterium]
MTEENSNSQYPQSDSSRYARILKEYVKAYNAHDYERTMAFYARDIRFEIVGVWVRTGGDEVGEVLEWDIETHIHMTMTEIHSRGNIIQCHLSETNDWLGLSGIGEMHYEPCLFVFQDKYIREIRAELTRESNERYMRAWKEISEWTTANRSKALLELIPRGKFMYGKERAQKWLSLLQEWRDATGR